jgi:glycosyltransferase involved in cell wall biosynthesis
MRNKAKPPLVSVVVPMYNAEKTIGDCLASIVSQSYKNCEIIVIDDGSTDGSSAIVEKIMKSPKGKNIRIINKPNGGVSSARNAGIKAAKGEYIALCDSDDEWLAGKLERQMILLVKRPAIDFIGCGRNNEGISFLFKRVKGVYRVTVNDLMFKMNPQSSTAVFKRNAALDVGFYNEDLPCAEDGDYWIRFCAQKKFFVTSDNLVVTGRGKPNYGFSGLSSNLKLMEIGELENLRMALNSGYISIFVFSAALVLSLAKYFRRVAVVKLRSLKGVRYAV